MFLTPALATAVPLVVFLGLVDDMFADDGFPPLAVIETLRLTGRAVGVASVYLFPVAVTVVAVGYVTATDSVLAVLTGVAATMLATAALLVMVVRVHLLPAATAVSIYEGLRAGLQQDALRGVTSGTCFFAWVGAVVLVVLAWSTFAATISRSAVVLLVFNWCAYAHAIVVTPVAEGVSRTTSW